MTAPRQSESGGKKPMAYDFHITRAALWAENEAHQILASEWLNVVDDDMELIRDPSNGPYSVRWNSRRSSEVGWFDWCDGNVYTTDPSQAAIAKMVAVAALLSAKVQGDDGEMYEPGAPKTHPAGDE